MSIEPENELAHAFPRPGVLKGLGVANIVFAVLQGLCIFSTMFWYVAAWSTSPSAPSASVVVTTQTQAAPPTGPVVTVSVKPQARGAGVPMVSAFNPVMMGMDDRRFVAFCFAENGTSLLTGALMFATGIGLLNRRRWAARGWHALAWAKIALAVLFWGFYIVAVAPGFSENMARGVFAMFAQQGIPQGRGPTMSDLTRVYSIMNLLLAVGAIVVSSIYPIIALWLLGRPGVRAAIVDRGFEEGELP